LSPVLLFLLLLLMVPLLSGVIPTDGSVRKHGICSYVRDGLLIEEVAFECPNVAAVHVSQFELWILSVYHPPSYNHIQNEALVDLVLDICEGREVIVLGDFILPSPVWSAGMGLFVAGSRT
jgi:hypothetical protein